MTAVPTRSRRRGTLSSVTSYFSPVADDIEIDTGEFDRFRVIAPKTFRRSLMATSRSWIIPGAWAFGIMLCGPTKGATRATQRRARAASHRAMAGPRPDGARRLRIDCYRRQRRLLRFRAAGRRGCNQSGNGGHLAAVADVTMRDCAIRPQRFRNPCPTHFNPTFGTNLHTGDGHSPRLTARIEQMGEGQTQLA